MPNSRGSTVVREWSENCVTVGFQLPRSGVQRLMRENGIRARHKRRYKVTTDSKHNLPIAPILLDRNFSPAAPNQVWTSDITYLRTDEGWLYLAIVLDLFNREVVGLVAETAHDCRHRYRCTNNGMVPQETCSRIDAPLRSG